VRGGWRSGKAKSVLATAAKRWSKRWPKGLGGGLSDKAARKMRRACSSIEMPCCAARMRKAVLMGSSTWRMVRAVMGFTLLDCNACIVGIAGAQVKAEIKARL